MARPVFHALQVFLTIQAYTRPTMLFSKRIAHDCDGIHWCFVSNIRRLHRNYSEIVVYICIRICISHGLILTLDLLFRVKDQIQILCRPDFNILFAKISFQNRKLFLCPCFISSLEQMLVFGRNFNNRDGNISKVFDKDVFAEGRITIQKFGLLIVLICSLLEFVNVVVNETASSLDEMPLTKRI